MLKNYLLQLIQLCETGLLSVSNSSNKVFAVKETKQVQKLIHPTIEAIEYSIENIIKLVCLPPHSSHHLQRLDTHFNINILT